MKSEIIYERFGIEDKLSQAIISILHTSTVLKDLELSVLREYEINHQHFYVLRFLNKCYPNISSIGQIKEAMIEKSPDISRLIHKLEKLGLIDKEKSTINRRQSDINISSEGRKRLKKINKELNDLFQSSFDKLDDAKAKELIELLSFFEIE